MNILGQAVTHWLPKPQWGGEPLNQKGGSGKWWAETPVREGEGQGNKGVSKKQVKNSSKTEAKWLGKKKKKK